MTDVVVYEPQRFRSWPYSSVSVYLKSLGLPSYAMESLMLAGRIEAQERGDVLAYGPEWIHIMGRGIIKETTPHGSARLWRTGMILGDISRVMLRKSIIDESGSRGSGTHIEFLHIGSCLSVTTRTFATLIEKEPVLALLLAQLTNERSRIVESVYGATKADPVIRVARLLEYLAMTPSRKGADRFRWTRTGAHQVPTGAVTLHGPSQADIADALGLGRTTVEKAIANLRAVGVLTELAPGTRSNRYYEIVDFGHLKSLARSET
ncbi:hypothetical protein [Streptomyces sp. NPDC096339]|uniref:hypothetical protein n=1 Tax=Streptomyces sp. NPDC096339 TaxID=3366086 RepID=UPI003815FB73